MNIKEARQQFDLLLSIENGKDSTVSVQGQSEEVPKLKQENKEVTVRAAAQHVTSPRKRRKENQARHASSDNIKMAHVMTLYDRSINLNNLSSDSSLYSAVREWMMNQPSQPSEPAKCESETDSRTVYCYDCTDTVPYPECALPKPIRGGRIPLRTEVDINTLRKMNIKRWKAIRQKWADTYEENYRAHPECVNIIKNHYKPHADDH